MRTYSVERSWRAGILAAAICGLALSYTGTAARGGCRRSGRDRFSREYDRDGGWDAVLQQHGRRSPLRAAPGATQATEWIARGTNGLSSVLGVLADDRTGTVYA